MQIVKANMHVLLVSLSLVRDDEVLHWDMRIKVSSLLYPHADS